ncbi:MAG: glutamine--fructose-6-phosphate transaminase (isomerizing) [bacterium]
MCGIVGYVGYRKSAALLLEGLKKLEYRGYDSAGIALMDESDRIHIRRTEGKLSRLIEEVQGNPCDGSVGIGHTRWATHGRPSEVNAHPHRSGAVVVVHNGIIENYLELRDQLQARGRTFLSETDTEIIAHLIDLHLEESAPFAEAVRMALKQVKGSYAIGVLCEKEPRVLIGAKKASPLVVGIGQSEHFLASDVPALLDHTRQMIFLEDEEMVALSSDGYDISDLAGRPVRREPTHISWTPMMAEKGGYKHFMLKEIHEQPRGITDTIRGRILGRKKEIYLGDTGLDEETLKKTEKIHLVACGTSWHAALVGKFMLESLARIPTEVDLGSEFRYRDPILGKQTLFISISQSGETADTLAAHEEARRKGCVTLAVCNVVDSSLARKSQGVFYTHAGPEMSVASTKAFTTQLTSLYLISLQLGRLFGRISEEAMEQHLTELRKLPLLLEDVLARERTVETVARKYALYEDFLYLGRGIHYPVALEGALKLKEISYIHAEGYPAGEMKHGPIALIDEHCPTVVLLPRNELYEKVFNNLEEVKARNGSVVAVVNYGDTEAEKHADDLIYVPESNPFLSPVLMTVPLQLLAYHIAVIKGTDVDQPRNLAKSVTVE